MSTKKHIAPTRRKAGQTTLTISLPEDLKKLIEEVIIGLIIAAIVVNVVANIIRD